MDFHDDYEDLDTQPSRRPRHAARIPDEVGEDIHQRMAAMMVRRMCNQHQCTQPTTGVCEHPNHRKDNDYLHSVDKEYPGMLDMLGFGHDYQPYTEDEKQTWLKWIGQSGPVEDAA